MSAMPIGVSMMPLENRHDTLIDVATTAERLGYDSYFLPETWAYDVTVLMAEAAFRTQRLMLGTGILGVWGRSAGTLAMGAASLAEASSGRFVLGLGASTAQLTEGLHDVPFVAPLARMRRTVVQVRALLRGERVPLGVATGARPLKLNLALRTEVPIFLAALTDESVRLAGELADGWLPFLYPRRSLPHGLALLREGAARSGDADRRVSVYPSIPTVVANDPTEARAGAAWFVSFYLTTMGPLYRRSLARQGFGREIDLVLGANTPRFAAAVPPEAEVLLEELTVFGTPAQARERLAQWHAAGADMPLVFIGPNLAPDEIERTLTAFAPMLESERAREARG
ncbi:MAG: LLM class flavin-dependent oxidoreductase [Candidatus Rokuibacteriota bacterium]|nr:MAG: LLM class flavin-dependent oxidoreductase [Candidatus Rokubacteria bacterium]PYO14761.1 MAG: LLM class flavin-dependent oxidoreductase [Candidatus Rokubacteria bacterium]